jgi:hypothetical protein
LVVKFRWVLHNQIHRLYVNWFSAPVILCYMLLKWRSEY